MNKYKARILLANAIYRQAQGGDPQAVFKVMPKIMSLLDSSDINEAAKWAVDKMNVSKEVATEGALMFADKYLKEEQEAAMKRVLEEVAKRFGVDPQVLARRAFSNVGMRKNANLQSNWEKVKNMSTSELVHNAVNFVTQYDTIKEAAKIIMGIIEDVSNMPPTSPTGLAVASVSEKIGKVTGLMMLISFIMSLGAAGTSDLASKVQSAALQNDEMKAIIMALSGWGITGILSFLQNLFRKYEQKDKTKHRFYQGRSL